MPITMLAFQLTVTEKRTWPAAQIHRNERGGRVALEMRCQKNNIFVSMACVGVPKLSYVDQHLIPSQKTSTNLFHDFPATETRSLSILFQ